MATDRELLELAANAAGVSIIAFTDFGNVLAMPSLIVRGDYWNPLHDDGDALRLAVKCGMHVGLRAVEVWRDGRQVIYVFDDDDDHYAATRRAIVRAAAEIGRSMLSTDQTR